MCAAIVSGIVTERASQLLAIFSLSPVTVPEFCANVSWAKLPSRFSKVANMRSE